MNKKEDLIKAGIDLFCKNGFHATGIDSIVKYSGISKMTLYKYFNNKDEFIISCLRYVHDTFLENFINKINKMPIASKEKILKIFQNLPEYVKNEKFIRCIFINAVAEFSDLNHPAHKIAIEHKICLQNYMEELLIESNIKDSKNIAKILNVLCEGALSMSQVTNSTEYYINSLDYVRRILE